MSDKEKAMTTIQLVALDIDGTLVNQADKVTDETKAMIKRVVQRGIHVLLCTGRSVDTSYPVAQALHLQSDLITVNGGEIWTKDKELIERHVLQTNQVVELLQLAEEHRMDKVWLVSSEGVFKEAIPHDLSAYDCVKFGTHSMDMEKMRSFTQQAEALHTVELSSWHPLMIEANALGVSKGSALESISKRLNIPMKQMMAIGDNQNDVTMIQSVGLGIAMGNATDALKQVADDVTDTNENNGVAHALEKYILTMD